MLAMPSRTPVDKTSDTTQHFYSSLCEAVVPRNISNALANFTVLEQTNSHAAEICLDRIKHVIITSKGLEVWLVKLAEIRWGCYEMARQHFFLVRMCLNALCCFHASSDASVLCSWSHKDAVRKPVLICAGIQNTKATRSGIVKTHHYSVNHHRSPLQGFCFHPT